MRRHYGVYTLFVLSVVIGLSNSFFLWGMNKSPPTEANMMYKVFKSSSIIEMFRNKATGKYYVKFTVSRKSQNYPTLSIRHANKAKW